MGVRGIFSILPDGGEVQKKSTDVHIECRSCGSNLAAEASECPNCGGEIVVYEL